MDDEKAYKDALERARKFYNDCVKGDNPIQAQRYVDIFPELKDSEDERIRKAISYAICAAAHQDGTLINDVTKDEAFAYLEKQKDFQFGYPGIYFYDGEKLHFQGNPAMEENQKEQQPISFNEPYNPDDYEVVMEGDATSLKRKEQQPAEWSEEDKKILENIILDLIGFRIYKTDEELISAYKDEIAWLKSLPERFNPQPKQEWSEDDEENFSKLHRLLVICQGEKKFIPTSEYDKLDNWLKFLKNRGNSPKSNTNSSHWKPSEEQMAVLYDAISDLKHDNYKNTDVLESLYNDLKKLSYEIY